MFIILPFYVPDLDCRNAGEERPYQVTFIGGTATATVRQNNQISDTLSCQLTGQEFDMVAQCSSSRFKADFFHTHVRTFSVNVYTITNPDNTLVAALPCWTNEG